MSILWIYLAFSLGTMVGFGVFAAFQVSREQDERQRALGEDYRVPMAASVECDSWPPPSRPSRSHRGQRYPRDHFCSHTQATAAKSQPMLTSGLSDTNVQTAALMRHKNIAKTPTRMLAIFHRPTFRTT